MSRTERQVLAINPGGRESWLQPKETELVLKDGTVVDGEDAHRQLEILRESCKDDPKEPTWLFGLANREELDESERNLEGLTKDGVMEPTLKAVILNSAVVEGDKITFRDPFMGPDQDHAIARHNQRLLDQLDEESIETKRFEQLIMGQPRTNSGRSR